MQNDEKVAVEQQTTATPEEVKERALKELSKFDLIELEDNTTPMEAQGCLSCS